MTDAERITALETRIAQLETRLAVAEAKTPNTQPLPWPVYIPQPCVLPRPIYVQPAHYYDQLQTFCSSQDTTVGVNS